MPDDLVGWRDRGTFAEKTMECKLKQTDDTDMCLSVISMIVGKYISQMETASDRVEISVLRPHRAGSGKKIVVEATKEADKTVTVMPLKTSKHGPGDVWDFIERFLPDYYHRDDILHYDIYSRYVDGEKLSEDDAEWIAADFGTDKDRVKETMEQMEKDFAYEALTCWLEGYGPECWG